MSLVYKRKANIEEAPLGGDLMLFDPEKSQFFVLNPTMAHIWRHCDGERDVIWFIQSISDSFSAVNGSNVASEVEAAFEEMVSLGVVTKEAG